MNGIYTMTLHNAEGGEITINIDHIECVFRLGDYTRIILSSGYIVDVTESRDEIFSLIRFM